MGCTLLSVLGFLSLNVLYSGHVHVTNRAVVTLQPNRSKIYCEETVTLTCEIEDSGDTEWEYEWSSSRSSTTPKTRQYTTRVSSPHTYWCKGQMKNTQSSTDWSSAFTLIPSQKPQPVLTVSPSWLSPGGSVTLNCEVEHPSAGWRFYWYKAVPDQSGVFYSYVLLPGSLSGTEQGSYVILGQTHTAGYVCKAGRGEPVYYTHFSEPKFVWSAGFHSVSLTVSPDRVQHFTSDLVSLSCEGNSTRWRVRRFSKALTDCSYWGIMAGSICNIDSNMNNAVYWCESETGQFSNAVNITGHYDVILVSPVHPVAEGDSVTLGCMWKRGNVPPVVNFYKNGKLIQNDTRKELTIAAVSKSDEGFYKCKDPRQGWERWTSTESWMSVKSSGPERFPFPVLLVVGPVCGVLLIILLLLFVCCHRTSKDLAFIRSQSTNQSSVIDHVINQDDTQHQGESSNVTYSLITFKNKKDVKNEPDDGSIYSNVMVGPAAGMSSSSAVDQTIYSEVKAGTALGGDAA